MRGFGDRRRNHGLVCSILDSPPRTAHQRRRGRTGLHGINSLFLKFLKINFCPSLKFVKYSTSSTFNSVGGVRQQFSLPENIKMSMFGAEFLRNCQANLECEKGERVDLQFNTEGYLFLATKKNADLLYQNHKIQL
jgi:hypothetical protein